jgi:AraC-like DNA-binding protein
LTDATLRARPTVGGFAVKCAIAALQKRNMAVQPLLRRAGLSEYDFDNPRIRMPATGQGMLLEYAAEATGDTALGLHLAEQANPRDVGLLLYVASAARDFGEALALFSRYRAINNESVRLRLSPRPEGVIVDIDFLGVSQHRVRQNTEFWIGMMIKAAREITGRYIRPTRVACTHLRNSGLREFERFYGCPVEFGAPSDQLAFSNETLAVPGGAKDPHLLKALRPICDEAVSARGAAVTLRASVESEVQRLLPQGQANARSVAKALSISARTLSRRLADEGTTYAEVVDQLRQSLALQYLKDPGVSISQIAWRLGYAPPSSFNHAFKRWIGCSPSIARDAHASTRAWGGRSRSGEA